MSTMATSGRSTLACRSASAVHDAVPATVTPCRLRMLRAVSRNVLLSSTSKQRMGTISALPTSAIRRIEDCWNSPARPPAAAGTGRRSRHLFGTAEQAPAPPGPPGFTVVGDSLGPEQVDLGEFGMELADFMFSPVRRAELVMGDRCQHEETRVGWP